MNFNLSSSKLYSLLLAFVFFISAQSTVEAQMTVTNATSCNMTVFIGQNQLASVTPCDLCPTNPPAPINIAAGATQVIFGSPLCGQEFGWIAWTNNFSTTFGISQNPGLFAACVPTIPGPTCPIAVIANTNAFWLTSGTGPVNVVIF